MQPGYHHFVFADGTSVSLTLPAYVRSVSVWVGPVGAVAAGAR